MNYPEGRIRKRLEEGKLANVGELREILPPRRGGSVLGTTPRELGYPHKPGIHFLSLVRTNLFLIEQTLCSRGICSECAASEWYLSSTSVLSPLLSELVCVNTSTVRDIRDGPGVG